MDRSGGLAGFARFQMRLRAPESGGAGFEHTFTVQESFTVAFDGCDVRYDYAAEAVPFFAARGPAVSDACTHGRSGHVSGHYFEYALELDVLR